MTRLEEQLWSELLNEVLIAVLKYGEVQGVQGLIVGGVVEVQYDAAHSFLDCLRLMALGGVEEAGPS